MRMLHVGWGYSPLFKGGVITYVEDLLRALALRGHEVHYFCCGRSDLRLVPHVKRWSREGIQVFELRNPPARITPYAGTRHPELDIHHPRVRRLFRQVLQAVRPEVVHIQEFLGLPAAIIEDVKAAGIRLVITLEDFHCLCPTQLLCKRNGEICRDYENGKGCVECCSKAPSEAGWMRLKSAVWHAARPVREEAPVVWEGIRSAGRAMRGLWNRVRNAQGNGAMPPADGEAAARAFRLRRTELVRLLNQADVVHGLSTPLCNFHREQGMVGERLIRLGTTVGAISQIRPSPRCPGRPLVFGFRGGFCKGKGGEVLLAAFRQIAPEDAVLTIHGPVDAPLRPLVAEAEARGQVRCYGSFSRLQVQMTLDGTDVGVMPPIWHECYPLIGLEFLAGRIPVIASRIGGIPDIIVDGRNGLLVPPGDVQALRQAIGRFIADPGLILRLRQQIGPVKTMEQHVTEVEAFYGQGAHDAISSSKT